MIIEAFSSLSQRSETFETKPGDIFGLEIDDDLYVEVTGDTLHITSDQDIHIRADDNTIYVEALSDV